MRTLLIATTAMIAVTSSSVFAQEYTIRLSHGDNPGNPTHYTALKFQELVDEYTDGAIAVEIFPNNQLGDEQEVVEALRTGTVQAEILATSNLQPFAPEVGLLQLPYLFGNSEEAHAGMDALIDPLNERITESSGVRILGYLEKGFRVLSNSQRPVESLDDLQGLRIRVAPTEVSIKAFQSWGIDPIPMAWAEVFSALQQRVIDGQENPYTTLITSNFYEVQDYVTEIRYVVWNGPLIVAEEFYQSLPEDYQQALVEAGREATNHGREVSAEQVEEAKDELRELGMTLSGPPVDEDEWRERARAVWPDLYDDVGGEEWAEEALEIIEEAIAAANN